MLTSRVAGIQPPLDGVTVDVNDAVVLQTEGTGHTRFGQSPLIDILQYEYIMH